MLTDIVPTKSRSTGIKTYAGNKSFFANYNGEKVKVYEPFNKDQLDLRLYIDKHPISKYFPKILGVEDNCVIEEFIVGNERVTEEQVYQFYKELMEVPYHKMTWDYYDYIYNRVGLTRPLTNWPLKVNHNDITKSNVFCVDGQLKIVDNEMLAMNDAWAMNTFNSDIMENKYINGINLVDHWRIRKLWKK